MHSVDDRAGERHAVLAQRFAEPDRLVERPALGRGDEHEGRLRGRAAARSTRSARALNSSVIPPSSVKNAVRSAIRSTPVTSLQRAEQGAAPIPSRRMPMPVGRRNTCSAPPPRNDVSRPGAFRNSTRVVRRRRVEHQQVVVAGDELVELLDRRELLRAGDGARELAIDPVALDLLGARRGSARRGR